MALLCMYDRCLLSRCSLCRSLEGGFFFLFHSLDRDHVDLINKLSCDDGDKNKMVSTSSSTLAVVKLVVVRTVAPPHSN